jgi:hypothetical protein
LIVSDPLRSKPSSTKLPRSLPLARLIDRPSLEMASLPRKSREATLPPMTW